MSTLFRFQASHSTLSSTVARSQILVGVEVKLSVTSWHQMEQKLHKFKQIRFLSVTSWHLSHQWLNLKEWKFRPAPTQRYFKVWVSFFSSEQKNRLDFRETSRQENFLSQSTISEFSSFSTVPFSAPDFWYKSIFLSNCHTHLHWYRPIPYIRYPDPINIHPLTGGGGGGGG